MNDSYITRSVVAAITSKQKPDWEHFDDLMIWALDTCQDQAAVFVMAAKLAHPELTIKEFDFYSWDKFVMVGRDGWLWGGRTFWNRGNKMPAWMFFLIAAEGTCVIPVKTWDAVVELRLRRQEPINIPLFEGVDVSASLPADFLREDAVWNSITGENGYSVITRPDDHFGDVLEVPFDVPTLEHIFDDVPIIKMLNLCKDIFVESAEGMSNNGGELYIYQTSGGTDDEEQPGHIALREARRAAGLGTVCDNLYRLGDRKEPFCEGRTGVSYHFSGVNYWLNQLIYRGYILDDTQMRHEIGRLFPVLHSAHGEVTMDIDDLTTLEEFALFMLDKGYIASMLNKLRTTTNGGRDFPPMLYLHFLTQAELAELPDDILEELGL